VSEEAPGGVFWVSPIPWPPNGDLIPGIPIQINVGDRGLKGGKVEMKPGEAAEAQNVELGKVLEAVRAALV
jgi:hypothetical protein